MLRPLLLLSFSEAAWFKGKALDLGVKSLAFGAGFLTYEAAVAVAQPHLTPSSARLERQLQGIIIVKCW